MATMTSPDGQPNSADAGQQPPTPVAQPPAAPPSPPPAPPPAAPAKDKYEEYRGVPIRDFADAKRAIDRKLELEDENRKLQTQLAGLQSSSTELAEKLAKMERAGRRREIMDVILEGAHPEHVATLGLLADGMHARGEIDLEAEQPKEAGKQAREKLAALFPSHYRALDGAPSAGQPSAPQHSYAGVKAWTDLTPEQQRSISKEDFARLFGPGASATGVGVVVPRR